MQVKDSLAATGNCIKIIISDTESVLQDLKSLPGNSIPWHTVVRCHGLFHSVTFLQREKIWHVTSWQLDSSFSLRQSWHKSQLHIRGKSNKYYNNWGHDRVEWRFVGVFFFLQFLKGSKLEAVSELCECSQAFFRLRSWYSTPAAAQREAAAKTGLWAPQSKMWLYMAHVHTNEHSWALTYPYICGQIRKRW